VWQVTCLFVVDSVCVVGVAGNLLLLLLIQSVWWVWLVNSAFTMLAVFHLAYLGLMFGSQSPEERELQAQVRERKDC